MVLAVLPWLAAHASGDAFFHDKIEPLLERHCFECHSHESGKTKGGLALDSRHGWVVGGESGPAIVPGDADASLLVQAIRHEHEDLRMPKRGDKLPVEAIAVFEEWVRRGAPDPRGSDLAGGEMRDRIETARREHWAFQPISNPVPPAVEGAEHPVDRFVRARLAEEGLEPNPRAAPRALVRRVYFDLIGLPPPFEEVQKFESQPTPDAFAAIIDDLLRRHEYGQRWARHWLDVARYADTFEQSVDGERRIPFAHTYRDYVVDAFNADKPFNRFIVEQIAGDRLPGLSPADLRGLGIYHVGRRFFANADGPALRVDDRIDVIGRGFLGLTLACARCHDHKFDAVPTQDYYSLYGILGSLEQPLELPEVSRSGTPEAVAAYEEKREAKLKEYEAHVDTSFEASKEHFRTFATEYLQVVVRRSDNHRTTKGAIPLDTPRGLLHYYGAHRWEALLEQCREKDEPFFKLWHELMALRRDGFAGAAAEMLAALPGDGGAYHPLIAGAFADRSPASMLEAAEIYGEVIRDAVADAEPSEAARYVADLVYGPGSPVPPASRAAVREDLHRFLTEKRITDRKQGEKARKLRTEFWVIEATGPVDRAMIVNASPAPLEPVVFLRGNPKDRGEEVPRRFLQVLGNVDARHFADDGRLQLARAIASPKNPLTARVIVNRVWQHHFGSGLVPTPDDFGTTGEPPSHPALLDHLASWLIAHDWSLKALHRYLLTSQTWQQSSRRNVKALERDPGNRLLWRMSPRKLEFEPLRDSLLEVSGRLDRSLGGRGKLLDETHRRRALYGHTDRYRIPALLRNFDVANPDTSISRRSETNIPLQSLYLLNSPFVRKQAEALLERPEVASANSPDERLDAVFRLVLSRRPSRAERDLSTSYLEQAGPEAWASLVHGLMLSNEFVYPD